MGKVFGVSMVKNEADIIGYNINYLLSQELDGFIIADNLSTDNTRAILNELAFKNSSIIVITDNEVGYYQSRKMTGLANMAAEFGAEWIVPFDADELWYSNTGYSLGSTLRSMREDVAVAKVWDHIPQESDPQHANPFKRIVNREKNPELWPCVAYRYEVGSVVLQGNHNVIRSGERNYEDISIRHFQYRSFEHFRSKLINGKKAYESTDLPETEGTHWRAMGALSDEDLSLEWNNLVGQDLIYDPAPIDVGAP